MRINSYFTLTIYSEIREIVHVNILFFIIVTPKHNSIHILNVYGHTGTNTRR